MKTLVSTKQGVNFRAAEDIFLRINALFWRVQFIHRRKDIYES